MTDVSNGENIRFPQLVDSAWGPVPNHWGRRCGSTRAVVGRSTRCVAPSSTEVGESRWKTRGRRGGRSSESSDGGPTVDSEAVNSAGLPQLIHRVTGNLSGPDGTYPQSPQHLRRRLVFSSHKSKTIIGLWMWAADAPAEDVTGARVPRQVRIKTFVAGGIA
jgi:hypothetical protein